MIVRGCKAELSRAECRVCLEDKRCLVSLFFAGDLAVAPPFEFAIVGSRSQIRLRVTPVV
jgi:hypothetical protein